MSAVAAKRKRAKSAPVETIVSYKGFDANLRCRDHQYEVGKTYTHEGRVAACEAGFHACENPLDVFGYYAPGESRFAIVEQSGTLARHDDDSKVASSKITIKAEIGIPALVKLGVEYIISRCAKPDPDSPATNTGDWSAATNTGNQSAATNTGNWSAASVEGKASVAIASGAGGRAKASKGSAIVLVNRADDGSIRHIRASLVGENSIKADTWYSLSDSGEFVEAA